MKCPQCGEKMNAYKEIRGLMVEMGITKEELKAEIRATIDSYVRSALSEDIQKYIGNTIMQEVRKELGVNGYKQTNKVQEVLRECLRDMVMAEVQGFKITVSIAKPCQEGAQDDNNR